MSGGLGALSMAWISIEASMPIGWRLMAPVRQPDSDEWLATAAGPLDGQTLHGRGAQPEQALRRLADELRRIRGSLDGGDEPEAGLARLHLQRVEVADARVA